MKLPDNYYHSYQGNGLDAVLIGYTGSMVRDKVGVDRCAWYKSDRYYPEQKLVQVAGRWPIEKELEHVEGSGWFELAPLGRTWYEVQVDTKTLQVQACEQKYVPQEGTLYSNVDYGPVRVKVTTFLHPLRSLLVHQYEFDHEVTLRAWMAPGVWVEDGWDTTPFLSVEMHETEPHCRYNLGDTQGMLFLRIHPAPTSQGLEGQNVWVEAKGKVFTHYFSIIDNRQGPLGPEGIDAAVADGYEVLRKEHKDFWRHYFSASSISIPDEQFQEFYDFSLYMFKAMQNRISGGLPVNNLRRTWSSHVFWDAYYVQRALIEANHLPEALESCRFFLRTQEAARRHAWDEFKIEGLKWDWEITHEGKKAYGALVHMKDQVHNNASYANMIWQYYELTKDRAMLMEFFPILEGMARFFLGNVIEKTAGKYGTRPVVGVSENPIRVRNECMTVAGSIIILRRMAQAAEMLGLESELSARCLEVSEGLMPTLLMLYNGRHFIPQEDRPEQISLAPMYPMQVLGFRDERCLSTTQAYYKKYEGRMVGTAGRSFGFPWSAGVLASVLTRQGRGQMAWEVIQGTRPAICSFGGMTEVMEDGAWNMQYFGTAQAAVCTALHTLLLQGWEDEIEIFPAVPEAWESCSFNNLTAASCVLSAKLDLRLGRIEGEVLNLSASPIVRTLSSNALPGSELEPLHVQLQPGERYDFCWTH